PLNPLHINPDLPEEYCDAIAAKMDKNPDKRPPTAAAVVELLAPWCDPTATAHLAEQYPPSSGILQRGPVRPLTPTPAVLAETAEFVLDDYEETAPSTTDSPSQISQGTVPISADSEDTLAHERQPPTNAARDGDELAPVGTQSWLWFGVALALLVVGFVVALVAILR
ncbi:MAG: hypothetical protein WD971_00700, partial [Pirellulales bacterium]